MTTSTSKVAVLGLGRMGGALIHRLVDKQWEVIGWSRSSRAPTGLPTGTDPATVVEGADVIVLALFDHAACAEVLNRCLPALTAGSVVVNTSTVAPDEARALEATVRTTGATYVHAPVIGSVPAARSGTLSVLVGTSAFDLGAAGALLADIGEVVFAGGVADAAALKLVANSALGGAVLAVRDSRSYAADLRISHAAAIDVLERGALGTLVKGRRDSTCGPATFTAAALAKDLALLAAETPAAHTLAARVSGLLASGTASADDDLFALTTPRGPGFESDSDEFGLSLAENVDAADAVLEPLRAYARGHSTGDPDHFRAAFLPSAHIEGMRDGEFVSWTLDDYCTRFTGKPATDESTRRRRINHVSGDGSVATSQMALLHGTDTFTDVFLLIRVSSGWRIANKAYHHQHP